MSNRALLATNRDAEDDESANMKQRRVEEVDFIMSHPTYDISLWFFSQQNRLRRFCQTLVTPPHGVRIFGEPPHSKRVTTFQLIIFFSIVASIVIAATATPHYRQKYCKSLCQRVLAEAYFIVHLDSHRPREFARNMVQHQRGILGVLLCGRVLCQDCR